MSLVLISYTTGQIVAVLVSSVGKNDKKNLVQTGLNLRDYERYLAFFEHYKIDEQFCFEALGVLKDY